MKVLSFAFCRDAEGHFGLIRSYSKGFLEVLFDDGIRMCRPSELVFV